jgi:hypothetical protein
MARAQICLAWLMSLIVVYTSGSTGTPVCIFGQKIAKPAASTPEEFTVFIKLATAKWSRVIRAAGITLTSRAESKRSKMNPYDIILSQRLER